jgi:phosphoribosylglycinamide formyltransferase-1
VRIAVLVSGTGSILHAMVDAGVPVSVVVADRACPALGVASDAGIATELVERASFDATFDRDAYSAALAATLVGHGINLVAMAGFGTVLTQPFHDVFAGLALNTHPALLPSFKGWHAVRDALAYGVKVTGCTVHVAGLDVDTGPILAQEAVPVLPDDTEATLHDRIKEVERRIYPAVLLRILHEGRVVA